MNKPWQRLARGDQVDIIAPSAKWMGGAIAQIKTLLESWGLVANISKDIYGFDLLSANTDAMRAADLISALTNTDSKAIWCLRGGYGCTKLIPQLAELAIPAQAKLLIGLSDITALHIFLQDHWHWQTLHAASASQLVANSVDPYDIDSLKKIIFGEVSEVSMALTALNDCAKSAMGISGIVTGGNLSIVQTSLATSWQIKTANKILFLEDINERAYKLDRMFTHLAQAGLLLDVAAVILGDFMGGEEPNGKTLVPEILQQFAERCAFAVYQAPGIGHGFKNHPLPLGGKGVIVNNNALLLNVPCV